MIAGTHKLNTKLYAWLFKEMTRVLKLEGTATLLTLERAIVENLLKSFLNFEVLEEFSVCVLFYFVFLIAFLMVLMVD